MLARFADAALTRSEMKNVKGGTRTCSCNTKQGVSFSFATLGDTCASPTSGLAYYEFTKNGKQYSGYVDNTFAASSCKFKSKYIA